METLKTPHILRLPDVIRRKTFVIALGKLGNTFLVKITNIANKLEQTSAMISQVLILTAV
jgi:hypothetical protein